MWLIALNVALLAVIIVLWCRPGTAWRWWHRLVGGALRGMDASAAAPESQRPPSFWPAHCASARFCTQSRSAYPSYSAPTRPWEFSAPGLCRAINRTLPLFGAIFAGVCGVLL
jgi:hypothetical protein